MDGFFYISPFYPDVIDHARFYHITAPLEVRGRYGTALTDEVSWMRVCGAEGTQIYEVDNCFIVADARIDGRDALCHALGIAGQPMPRDAHLILLAYLKFGERCVERLIGDYSFVIFDMRDGHTFAARDPLGKRSLYYAQSADWFACSNEIRPLLRLPGLDEALDPLYIADFLMLGEGFWIDRTQTPYRAIRRLDRGHTLTLTHGQVVTRQSYTPPFDAAPLRFRREADALDAFRAVFDEAVSDRLRDDRVVLTLSGGMDSSTVTATALDLIRRRRVQSEVTAVTTTYRHLPDEEAPLARATAAHLGIADRHVVYDIGAMRLIYPYVHVANAIRQTLLPMGWVEFQRALAGYGSTVLYGYMGDLLLSDQPIASAGRSMRPLAFASAYRSIWRYWGKRPALESGLFSRRRGTRSAQSASPYPLPVWMHPDFVQAHDLTARWDDHWARLARLGEGARSPFLMRMLLAFDHYAHDESDAIDFPMAQSVDPFADVRVIDLLLRLPPLPWFHQKYLTRRLMADRLPDAIVRRPKRIVGDMAAYMLEQPENAWVDHWSAASEVGEYIVREKIPPVTGRSAAYNSSIAVHLRPLLLDRWLRTRRGASLKGQP